jgi:hypothetical protein
MLMTSTLLHWNLSDGTKQADVSSMDWYVVVKLSELSSLNDNSKIKVHDVADEQVLSAIKYMLPVSNNRGRYPRIGVFHGTN